MSLFMRKFYNGFTLIEAVVALFVFLIIMLSLSNTFTQSFAGYRNTRAVQKDVENAQFALNLMAKELRTSTVVSSGGTKKIVKFYDHSQSICFEYKIIDDVNDKLTVSKKNIDTGNTSYYDDPDDPSTFNPFLACAGSSGFSSATDLIRIENTGGKLEGNFAVVPSDKNSSPKKLGKITISLQISEGPKHTANVQTTSSLRDFGYVEVAP
jgi:type II secretory pathway pseudopilin PulG